MIYLFVSIILSVSMAVIIKIGSRQRLNMLAVTTTSYFVSLAASLYLAVRNDLLIGFRSADFGGFFAHLINTLSEGGVLTGSYSLCYAVLLGSVTGVFFFMGFLLLQINIKNSGVAITSIFMKGAVIIPLIFAFIVLKEKLLYNHVIGIVLSITAIVMASIPKANTDDKMEFSKMLLLAFFVAGFVELSSKLFQRYALIEHKDIYLLFIFVSAFLSSAIVLIVRGSRISVRDTIVGTAISLPNLFTSYFLVLALSTMKASVVYVLSSSCSIMLTLIIGMFFFREKLNSRQIISILLTVVAVVLINIV